MVPACVLGLFSCVRLCVILWAVGCQVPCPWDSPAKNTGAKHLCKLQVGIAFACSEYLCRMIRGCCAEMWVTPLLCLYWNHRLFKAFGFWKMFLAMKTQCIKDRSCFDIPGQDRSTSIKMRYILNTRKCTDLKWTILWILTNEYARWQYSIAKSRYRTFLLPESFFVSFLIHTLCRGNYSSDF